MSEPDPKQVEVMTRLGLRRGADPEHATVTWLGDGFSITLLEEETPTEIEAIALIAAKRLRTRSTGERA